MAKANKKARDEDQDAQKDEFRRESLEFFKKPDLLSYIKKELDKDHIDDDCEKMFTFCSEVSSRLPPEYRFSTALTGYTSEGKTNIWKTTSRHLPRSWYLDLTRATKATLEDDIKAVNLIYFGEESANKDIVETVKQLVEDGISAMKKDLRNDNKSVRIETQPRKVGIYSTTADASDRELATRYAVACITGSPDKYRLVNMNTLTVAGNVDLEIDRSIRNSSPTWITVGLEQLQPVDIVTIPYSHLLTVDNKQARSMRDLKRFLNLIRSLAWLCQHRRFIYKYRDKTVLIASPADFWNAMEIGSDIFAQSLSGVEQRLQNVIDSYQRLTHDKEHPEYIHLFERDGKPDPKYDNELTWIDRSLLQDDLSISSRDTIRSHITSLESMGLFASVWTGNRNFVAMKHHSATNSPTKYPLITDERIEIYHKIKTLYNEKVSRLDVGEIVTRSPEDSSLLKLLSEEKRAATNTKKNGRKASKTGKKSKNQSVKLVGDIKPADVKKFCKENYDDEKTISYERLIEEFPEQLICDLRQCGLLKPQANGNYRYMEAIANDET